MKYIIFFILIAAIEAKLLASEESNHIQKPDDLCSLLCEASISEEANDSHEVGSKPEQEMLTLVNLGTYQLETHQPATQRKNPSQKRVVDASVFSCCRRLDFDSLENTQSALSNRALLIVRLANIHGIIPTYVPSKK